MRKLILIFVLLLSVLLVSCQDMSCKHEFGEWQVGKAASCSENGYSERVCALCGEGDRKIIYTTEHPYSSEWVFDGNYHWHAVTCEHKGASVGKGAHVFDGNKCTICLALRATQGLEYRGNLGEGSYRVVGIGTTLDSTVVIARYYNGYPIVAIDSFAFKETQGLTGVYIQQYITSIGEGAFMYCSDLVEITIEHGVEYLGDDLFFGCSSLRTINYVGTKAEWKAIEKASGWDRGLSDCEIVCLDGVYSE